MELLYAIAEHLKESPYEARFYRDAGWLKIFRDKRWVMDITVVQQCICRCIVYTEIDRINFHNPNSFDKLDETLLECWAIAKARSNGTSPPNVPASWPITVYPGHMKGVEGTWYTNPWDDP